MQFIKRLQSKWHKANLVMFRARRYRVAGLAAQELPVITEYVRVLEGLSYFQAKRELRMAKQSVLSQVRKLQKEIDDRPLSVGAQMLLAAKTQILQGYLGELIILEHTLFPTIDSEDAYRQLTLHRPDVVAMVENHTERPPLFSDNPDNVAFVNFAA